MENAMESHFEKMERHRDDIWAEAGLVAEKNLKHAKHNSEILPEKNDNPYPIGVWQYVEWETAYEHYINTGLGY
jgi:hypothetical protein